MKKLLFILCWLMSAINLNAQILPPPHHDPNPICVQSFTPVTITTCFADIEKVLARTISLDGLADENRNPYNEWNSSDPCNNPSYACVDNNCQGNGGYCPDRYKQDINLAVSLNASMILGVVQPWGSLYEFSLNDNTPGSPNGINTLYHSAKQAVLDINAAYDCANLRRPIIGANIVDHIDNSINGTPIPATVINEFVSEMTQTDYQYYVTNNSGYTVHFTDTRIGHAGTTGSYPDIINLEARMLFYYLATRYIDLGYRELTPDFISSSIKEYEVPTMTYDQRYWANDALQKIRTYAANKNQLLIIPSSVHNFHDEDNTAPNVDDFFYQGNAMFDFRYSATRPLDSNPSIVPSCSGQYYTELIDQPRSEAIYPTVGYTSPYAGCTRSRVPFLIDLDYHGGICQGENFGVPTGDVVCPWGADESRWFSALGDQCQSDWVKYAYMQARQFYYSGFFAMPGIKVTSDPTKTNYRMNNNTALVNEVKNDLWKVNLAEISYTENCYDYTQRCILNGLPVGFGYKKFYVFNVTNPDYSSMYTWHVQLPDGSWLPYTYGNSVTVLPTQTGTYMVGVRQDNWGLPNYINGQLSYGVYTQSYTMEMDPTPNCCLATCCTGGIVAMKTMKPVDNLISQAFPEEGNVATAVFQSNEESTVVNNLSANSDLIISPNPASKNARLDFYKNGSKIRSIEICDVVGRLREILLSNDNDANGIYETEIDLSSFNSGMYMVILKTDNGIFTKKLSVLK